MSIVRSLHKREQKRSTCWFVWSLFLFAVLVLGSVLLFPGASVLNRMSWLDSGICAQFATHSFYPGGQRLPLCARNTGIYLGFMVAFTTLYGKGRLSAPHMPRRPLIIVLVCGVIALAVDGINSFLLDLHLPHLYTPDNLLRLGTGLVTGLAMALLLLPNLNRLLWRGYSAARSMSSGWEFLLYIPLLVVCFFGVASQNALLLYPIALISTAGVLTVLGGLNLLVIVGVSRRDETFERFRELLPFLGLALLLAVGEMLLLAQLKLSLLQALGI